MLFNILLQLSTLSILKLAQGRVDVAAVELDISPHVPGHASRPIQPGFVGFACETSSFPSYSGNEISTSTTIQNN